MSIDPAGFNGSQSEQRGSPHAEALALLCPSHSNIDRDLPHMLCLEASEMQQLHIWVGLA